MTLSRNTPRGDRMPATLSAAFTTAMRMVHRVHGSAAHSGTNAQPALSPCLAIRAQRVFLIADLADGRSAVAQDTPHFTGAQPQGCIASFTRDQLRRGTRRTRQLRALAGLHLDTMHLRADRNVAQRKRIANFDRRIRTGNDLIPGLDAAGGDNITPLAVGIKYQSDIRRAVGIVLDPLDARRDAVLVALEVDDAVTPLVAAADMPGRDTTLVVATAGLGERLKQRRVRLTLPQIRVLNLNDEASSRRCWFRLNQCHDICPY